MTVLDNDPATVCRPGIPLLNAEHHHEYTRRVRLDSSCKRSLDPRRLVFGQGDVPSEVVPLRGPNPGPNDDELAGSRRIPLFTRLSLVPTTRRLGLEKATSPSPTSRPHEPPGKGLAI